MQSDWTNEKVYFTGRDYFDDMLKAIGVARSSIDFETYIFEVDRLGEQVLQALSDAAKRGLRVRVLIDGVGSWNWSYAVVERLIDSGVAVRIYHPLPWRFSKFYLRELPRLDRIYGLLSKINRRNHKKVCLIDENLAFVGSMNVTETSLTWRETGVCIQGREIQKLFYSYELAWRQALGFLSLPPLHPARKIFKRQLRSPLVRLNHFRRMRKGHYHQLLRRIRNAKHCVWLTNPYFVPPPKLINALCKSAKKGVDVRLLLPQKSDVPIVQSLSRSFYYDLLKSGVRVFEYTANILHAKSGIIDSWSIVGSSNLNYRSLYHDLEVDIVLRKQPSLTQLARQFESDLQVSKEVKFNELSKRGILERLFGRLMLLVKSWM